MQTDFLKSLKNIDNLTLTENGAVALKSTQNYVLDAFGSLGAMKCSSEDTIIDTFMKAYLSDQKLAMRLLFYIRDIRGGQGMRRVFRVITRYLACHHPEALEDNLDNFLFFGRGDDLLVLLDTPLHDQVIKYIESVLEEDLKTLNMDAYPTLLAKWLPSENTSSKATKALAKEVRLGLKLSSKHYRQILSKLRAKIGIVERLMSANEWDKINFEKLPAKAAMIYSDAFLKHVEANYIEYLKKLSSGDARINAASLFPVDIIKKVYQCYYNSDIKDKYLYNAMWNALPNYFGDTEETGICMCDTSGSMGGEPLYVSLALGLYCADKAKGPFKNHFITFDLKPTLQEIKGDNIFDKVASIRCINPHNTNFEAALQLILDAAVINKLQQEDLPSKLYVISDMQFDEATGKASYYGKNNYKPFMQQMKEKFAEAGYIMPAIVYWNVRASKCGMFQETYEGENCCMVSGYSASLFKSVIDGTQYEEETVVDATGETRTVTRQKIDPMQVMLTTLMNERYDRVK